MLNRIGVDRMAYKLTKGMGDYVWATAGNGLTSARDFARLGYLMLYEGEWEGAEIYPAAWQRLLLPSVPTLSVDERHHALVVSRP